MKLVTLKKRREFLRVRDGARFHATSFVMEGKRRVPEDGEAPRFGFTVTKRLGGAVRRNRIRRRLKAAVVDAAAGARAGTDYVIIARDAAFDAPFPEMVTDFEKAFQSIERRLSKASQEGAGGPSRHGPRRDGGKRGRDPTNKGSTNNDRPATR